MRASFAPFVVVALLLGAPALGGKHPRNLVRLENGPSYVLAEDFVATEKAATFTLKAGTYVASFEDSLALYLLGGANCLEMHVVPPKQPEHAYTQPFTCGVYYPKSGSEPARFFVVRGALPRNPEMGLIVNWIIKAGEGSFDYPISKKNVIGLRDRLQVVSR